MCMAMFFYVSMCVIRTCMWGACVGACVCLFVRHSCVWASAWVVLKLTVSRQPEDIFMSSLSVDTNQ